MSLRTVGSIFKFAIKLEQTAEEFYKKCSSLFEIDDNIISQYQKRIKRLKRLQRENTTEMILEPIKDFSTHLYVLKTDLFLSTDKNSLFKQMETIEKKLEMFFKVSAEKIDFLPEVETVFKQIANQHNQNVENL